MYIYIHTPGSAIVGVMADNNSVVTGGPGEDTTVTDVVLNVADNGTLGDGAEGEDVADDEIGLLATIDELAGVHTLSGDEELLLKLVAERVAEGDLGERSAAAGVVEDVGDDALDVAVALAEVEGAEPRRTLAVVGVGLEHRPRTLTLGADDTTHLLGGGRWLGFLGGEGDMGTPSFFFCVDFVGLYVKEQRRVF